MAQSVVNRFNADVNINFNLSLFLLFQYELTFSFTKVILIGPIGPKLKELLNPKIKIPNEVLIEKDEVHLILEYDSNQEWNELKSPQSNRFIVSHDIYNSKMEMLDLFFNLTNLYDPNVIILAGFHLIESQSEQFR